MAFYSREVYGTAQNREIEQLAQTIIELLHNLYFGIFKLLMMFPVTYMTSDMHKTCGSRKITNSFVGIGYWVFLGVYLVLSVIKSNEELLGTCVGFPKEERQMYETEYSLELGHVGCW